MDGAGVQAQGKMSAICLAMAYGLTYVHTPFQRIAHPECGMAEWVAAWESLFNFGHGHISVGEADFPVVSVFELMSDKNLRKRPFLLTAGHYNRFTNLFPDAYLGVIPSLRANYYLTNKRKLPRPSSRCACT
jgi:hypothetical protein